MSTDYSVYVLSRKEKARFLAACSAAFAAIAYLFYHEPAAAAAAAAASFLLPKHFAAQRAALRKKQLRDQFRDLLYSLSASFAAGRSMEEALREGSENLQLLYPEGAALIGELTDMDRSIREANGDAAALLVDFGRRSGVEEIRNFTEVYGICRTTGADTERTAARTANMLMERMAVEKEIHALTAQKRFEGNIISVMPVVVVACLTVSAPDYLEVLYTTLAGRLVMTGVIGLTGFAYWLMLKLTDIHV